jgi:hypothetical protein
MSSENKSAGAVGTTDPTLHGFALEALSCLGNRRLADALHAGFMSRKSRVDDAQRCFWLLTSKSWSRSSLEAFFHGWRDTHLTMTSVAAMMTRLLDLSAAESSLDLSLHYVRAAHDLSKVMAEDLGLCGGVDHSTLFTRMATAVCSSPDWESRRNRDPSCARLRKWVYAERVSSPDVVDGMLLSVASEIYNHAEMRYLNGRVPQWLVTHRGFDPDEAHDLNQYVEVHAHGVETDHFGAAFSAVEHYYAARGNAVDYTHVQRRCEDYLDHVGEALAGLARRVFV